MAAIVDCNNYESVELTLLTNKNIYSSTNMMLAKEANSELIHTNYLNNSESSLDDIDMDFESPSEIEASEYIKDFNLSSSSDNPSTSIEYKNNNEYHEDAANQQIITNITNTTTRVIQSPYMPNIDSES